MKHAYPHQLSEEILRLWGTLSESEPSEGYSKLPDREVLEYLISTCYQVSMMSEEVRSQRFRIALCDPSEFHPELGPPHGFLRIVFKEPRAFHEYELLKLSPASEFESSLIGIRHDPAEGLLIWGMINSGTRWIQAFQGGSKVVIPMPDSLVLDITGPGSIRAYRGSRILAQLSAGRIIMSSTNVLHSRWIAKRAEIFKKEIMEMHIRSRPDRDDAWATVSESFVVKLYEQVIKRIISSIRNTKHGGTIIFLPPGMIQSIASHNPYVFIKYMFRDEKPVRRLHWLTIGIMNELAKLHGLSGKPGNVVGWSEYVAATNKTLLELDEALFECARFIANLATVDGAVVLTRGLDLVGFGGLVKGAFSKEDFIARAMDAEGEQRVYERAEGVGTRHLAAYHLCKEIPDALAIVISQDGNTSFVTWMNDFVTYWDFLPMTVTGSELL
ncbi:MAG: putative sensor domain DACNV-containing protein [Thermodesulfobacteriota bacterium]